MSDLKSIVNEPSEGCSANPNSDENFFGWSATIFGPDETPWEGGVSGLRLTFGDNYPKKPPRCYRGARSLGDRCVLQK
ncbi:hypothetical protein GIB67_007044 [Kingdonia uniflora]|uniref:UBC core domain-containing protein n=1 Tax=Kingdonia uniflora TaxID=39325 RepID=A0A7J7NZC0_9MAGN|nr:hypothetical protein GIB67_007044 [Kingdonia uniflora]